ncbi:MAG: hypothetical protein H7Z37_09615, partial [Pyrinomonadaceae bacterium]|nr:hypothetical protein [Pyrinomonadaceae bacterium]
QNGNVVTGTLESPQGATPITSGTITGNAFTIKSTAGANGEITFTGKLENSALSGNVEAPQGATTFTGTKAQ